MGEVEELLEPGGFRMWWALAFGDWLFGYFCTGMADTALGRFQRRNSAHVLKQAMEAAQDTVIDNVPDQRARSELAAAFKALKFPHIKIVPDAATPPGDQVRQAVLESLAPLIEPDASGRSMIERVGLTQEWLVSQFIAAVTLVLSQVSSDRSLTALADQMNKGLMLDAAAELRSEVREWRGESERLRNAIRINAAIYFAGELSRLWRYAMQPSYEALAEATGTTADVVASVLASTAPLPDWNAFCEPLVMFCRDYAVGERIIDDPDAGLGSMRDWQAFWKLAEQGNISAWGASPLPSVEHAREGTPHATSHREDEQAEIRRRRVLDGAGLTATLRSIYPQYPLVELWGVPMPISVLPARSEERRELESPLLKPLVNRTIPGPEQYPSAFDPAGLSRFEESLERYQRSTSEQRRHFFSGPTYALQRITRNDARQVRIECRMGRYFLNDATSECLDPELTNALIASGDAPVGLEDLPRRAWIHQNAVGGDPVTDGTRKDGALSHATVVMIAATDDEGCYDILLPARSSQVETHRGYNHVAPSGILAPFNEISPTPQMEFSVWRNFCREWVEELYNAIEHERPVGLAIPDPEEQPEITRLQAADADLYYTGISVNLMTLRPEICMLLLINDPYWFDAERQLASKMRLGFNWEYSTEGRQQRIATDQPDHWRIRLNRNLEPWDGNKLKPTFLVPNAAAAIRLAIDTVKDIQGQK